MLASEVDGCGSGTESEKDKTHSCNMIEALISTN